MRIRRLHAGKKFQEVKPTSGGGLAGSPEGVNRYISYPEK
jgi:hypothetical protein